MHNHGKKVIMIDKIKSNYIEQAIIILKQPAESIENNYVIDEAYEIINNQEQCLKNSVSYSPPTFKNKFKRFLKAFWF